MRLLVAAGTQLARSSARPGRWTVRGPLASAAVALAQNLWWSWDDEADLLFRELDPVWWRELDHNPIALAGADADRQARERARATRAAQPHQLHLSPHAGIPEIGTRLGRPPCGRAWARPVAYFSAEFGLHESLPIYSGGLGILAGDHIKSASDLGIPLVGVGPVLRPGIFPSGLDLEGWQQEDYLDVDSRLLPFEPALTPAGKPLTVKIETRTGNIIGPRLEGRRRAAARCCLLDSDVEGNQPEDRELTARLYGGDRRVRIRQELLLGVGGVRALQAWHFARRRASERGAQRFCRLECAPADAAEGMGPTKPCAAWPARWSSRPTHRSRPATTVFRPDLIEEHLGPLREALGLRHDAFMASGRVDPYNPGEEFCMTVLALKLSRAPMRFRRCTARSRAPCGPASSPAAARKACRSAISPTASTC